MKKYNLKAAEKTLAAFETSTDYDRLYKLAKQGYKIPCFLWDNLYSEDTLFFRIVVCKKVGNLIVVSECGREYLDDMDGLNIFKKRCEKLELKFIVPHIQDISKNAPETQP